MKLSNKNILLTGGTSGVGLALIHQLCNHNRLFVIARDKTKVEQLKLIYPNVEFILADLSHTSVAKEIHKKLESHTSQLDLLINNAAIQYTPVMTAADFDPSSIGVEITINFTSVCELCFHLIPLLEKTKGYILNINSGLALVPKKHSAIYCASKAALNSFSISLRSQLSNSSVNVLQAFLPLVDTPMTQGRGNNKITPEEAAKKIIYGVNNQIQQHHIGKVKLLNIINRLSPTLAQKMMANS